MKETSKTLKHSDVWTGIYKGISFEIRRWDFPSFRREEETKDAWNSYIYLNENAVPEDLKKHVFLKGKKDERGRVSYDYYGSPILNKLEFRGGITYYDFESTTKGNRLVKIGCDYLHSWDEDHYYSLENVEYDIKKTIDSLWETIPELKVWCNGNGKWYNLSEGELTEERFYSFEYKDKYEEDRLARVKAEEDKIKGMGI